MKEIYNRIFDKYFFTKEPIETEEELEQLKVLITSNFLFPDMQDYDKNLVMTSDLENYEERIKIAIKDTLNYSLKIRLGM